MAKKSAPKKADSSPKKKIVKKQVSKTHSVKKAAPAEQSFFEFRITQQTLYWVILGAASITFALWLYTLDAKVRDLYDQLDASMYSSDIGPVIKRETPTEE